MEFASDNTAPAAPQVLAALAEANDGYAPSYGADALMDEVRERVRDIFEVPEAAVYLVATGTAANALSLAVLANPWEAVFVHRTAHVKEDEAGAPEFYTSGAKLVPVAGADGRIDPNALRQAMAAAGMRGVHSVQRGPLSLTQITELGTAYSVDQIAELAGIARAYGVGVHMDGARFANAVVATGASPAELTWKAGVDVLSFGGTKNGLMGVEAVVLFDPERAWEFELRRKRGGHLFSKHRYLSAQMAAYLRDGLWLELADRANRAGKALAEGIAATPGARLLHPADANMVFAEWPRTVHRRLRAAGAHYYTWPGDVDLDAGDPDDPVAARLVASWSTTADDVERFLTVLRG